MPREMVRDGCVLKQLIRSPGMSEVLYPTCIFQACTGAAANEFYRLPPVPLATNYEGA